jgi:hypothetical protein
MFIDDEVIKKIRNDREERNMARENLIPFNKRGSEDEVKKINRKGGIKSGQVRREKKKLREVLNELLDMQIKGGMKEKIKSKYPGLDVDKLTNRGLLGLAMIGKAVGAQEFIKADVSASQFIRDTIGEKPVDKVATTNCEGNDRVIVNDLSKIPKETLLEMAKAAGVSIDE